MNGVQVAAAAMACAFLASCARDRAIEETQGGAVHPSGIADPASPAWHGALLRGEHWSGMLDPEANDACGRCHEGAPAKVTGVTSFAPGATACTTCHTEPNGPLACTTCHAPRGPHGAHVNPSSTSSAGLSCSTCHPIPGPSVIGGLHGDGQVEVIFDSTHVAPERSYDPSSRACAVSCHDRGGARPRPTWNDTSPIVCGDCHQSPPTGHFKGACSSCHTEANATGTSLSGGALHMNAKVDLGDGSGGCGACHGKGNDPLPSTGAHRSHANSPLSADVACTICHVVPKQVIADGHLDGVVGVVFSGLATARSANAQWDGHRCNEVACHGAKLVDPPMVVPAWRDTSGAPAACGACHGLPPTQHTPSTSCERSTCHGDEVTRDAAGVASIAPQGRLLHINGVIDHAL